MLQRAADFLADPEGLAASTVLLAQDLLALLKSWGLLPQRPRTVVPRPRHRRTLI
jgi:hypothetical protein